MSIIERISPEERDRLRDARKQCRMLGHRWEEYYPGDFNMTPAFYAADSIFHVRCETCGTERHDAFMKDGELDIRRYDYPDGYRYDEDEERPTLQDIRLWMVKRNRAMMGKRRG